MAMVICWVLQSRFFLFYKKNTLLAHDKSPYFPVGFGA
jgi:hypothetical protein